jgi:hypothetical protein
MRNDDDQPTPEQLCQEQFHGLAAVLLPREDAEDPYWDREAVNLLAALIESLGHTPAHRLLPAVREAVLRIGEDPAVVMDSLACRPAALVRHFERPVTERNGVEAQLKRRLSYFLRPDRPSALGKYRDVLGSSDDFAARKQHEIDLEDRRNH